MARHSVVRTFRPTPSNTPNRPSTTTAAATNRTCTRTRGGASSIVLRSTPALPATLHTFAGVARCLHSHTVPNRSLFDVYVCVRERVCVRVFSSSKLLRVGCGWPRKAQRKSQNLEKSEGWGGGFPGRTKKQLDTIAIASCHHSRGKREPTNTDTFLFFSFCFLVFFFYSFVELCNTLPPA